MIDVYVSKRPEARRVAACVQVGVALWHVLVDDDDKLDGLAIAKPPRRPLHTYRHDATVVEADRKRIDVVTDKEVVHVDELKPTP
jgi:hypothetical protein